MNRVVFSRWEPITYSSAEFYLDNGEMIVMPYKDIKNFPQTVKSVEGNEYSIIADGGYVLGFRKIK